MPCHILLGMALSCFYAEQIETKLVHVVECRTKSSDIVVKDQITSTTFRVNIDMCKRPNVVLPEKK